MKAFSIDKFRKSITKQIDGLSSGFRDPQVWIHTGCFGLNYLISGDFYRGVPLGKVSLFAGESGAGKSFIISGNLVRNAQQNGIFVVLVDTENALDERWLKALGVDTSEDKLLKLNMAMIDDIAKTISEFVKEYREIPIEDRPKVLFVIDSLSMALVPSERNQFESGDLKGDMGRKPKALGALVRNCVNMFGDLDIGMACSAHSYASQDMFQPDDKISGGSVMIYASSIVVAMGKLKLKEDEEGNKTKEVLGIRAKCKVMKTRYSKPFEEIEIQIPYETGMSEFSGLFDLFEKKGLLVKEGNRYKYHNEKTGSSFIEFKKNWSNEMLRTVMDEFRDTLENGKRE